MNKLFKGTAIKKGNEMLALVKHGNVFHAIIHIKAKDEYVVCYDYNTSDGTWIEGHYCKIYEVALKVLVRLLSKEENHV